MPERYTENEVLFQVTVTLHNAELSQTFPRERLSRLEKEVKLKGRGRDKNRLGGG